jgi:hypothetical protein
MEWRQEYNGMCNDMSMFLISLWTLAQLVVKVYIDVCSILLFCSPFNDCNTNCIIPTQGDFLRGWGREYCTLMITLFLQVVLTKGDFQRGWGSEYCTPMITLCLQVVLTKDDFQRGWGREYCTLMITLFYTIQRFTWPIYLYIDWTNCLRMLLITI